MSPSQHDSLFPDSPGEFLASWSATRGNLRRFLEDRALPPIDEESQRTAGEAANVIAGEYDATAEAVRQDVVSTVSTLITESVLEVVTDDI